MSHKEENDAANHEESNSEIQPTYNFKWMLILLLVGIIGSFIFASVMK
jgi:hypothetical protein